MPSVPRVVAFPYALLDLGDHQVRKLLLARGVYVVGQKGLLVEACAYEDVDAAGLGDVHDVVHITAHAQVRDLKHIAHPQILQCTELLDRLVLAVQTAVGILLDPGQVDRHMLMHHRVTALKHHALHSSK